MKHNNHPYFSSPPLSIFGSIKRHWDNVQLEAGNNAVVVEAPAEPSQTHVAIVTPEPRRLSVSSQVCR